MNLSAFHSHDLVVNYAIADFYLYKYFIITINKRHKKFKNNLCHIIFMI